MMEQFTRIYPDGSRGAYTVAPGSTLPLALATLKPLKKPARGRTDKRKFPDYVAGITSTADYIRQYFYVNTGNRPGWPHAYAGHLDHRTLYQPLPDEPAALYQGADSVETVEGDEGGA